MARVSLWDPNGINPYSIEIANVLLGAGFKVTRWLPAKSVGTSSVDGCRDVSLLATNARSDGRPVHILLRLAAPPLFLLVAAVRRDAVVICWVRGAYESLIFAAAAPLLSMSVLVDHNPVSDRNSGTSVSYLADLLRRKVSSRVVHRKSFSSPGQLNSVYIPHPRYSVWAHHMGIELGVDTTKRRSECTVRVLLLGALRPDKGWDRMHELFSAVDPESVSFLVVGTGQIPAKCQEIVLARNIFLDDRSSPDPVSDIDIARGIKDADLMVAAYTNPTASGTIMLAFSCGLPTIAFNSEAFSEIMTGEALVDGDDFADIAGRIAAWRAEGFSTYRMAPTEVDLDVQSRWSEMLADRLGLK